MKLSQFIKMATQYAQYLIEYTNWSDFENKLNSAGEFTEEKEFIEKLGMDYASYEKIVSNMIFHWKDSVSKSLLHSISNLHSKMPIAGSKMFKNILDQTRALLIMGPGVTQRDIFGGENSANGLGLISRFDMDKIKNEDKDIKDFEGRMKRFVEVSGFYAITVTHPKIIDKINEIVQYIWLYVYIQKQKLEKVKKKIPKYLYRGIRISTLFAEKNIKEIIEKVQRQDNEAWSSVQGKHVDLIINYILDNGVDDIIPGKFLSFTASLPISEYFANGEGLVLRVESSKVDIITSELTEPLFAEKDYVSGKKEREYIVKIPEGHRFIKGDIIISNLDWFIYKNNPLCVQYFDHKDKGARYTLNGVKIRAQFYWHTNERGSVNFVNESEKDNWSKSRMEFKKEFGFDPMPTEKNLDQIKNFQFFEVKERW
jgi:hypothetical protein